MKKSVLFFNLFLFLSLCCCSGDPQTEQEDSGQKDSEDFYDDQISDFDQESEETKETEAPQAVNPHPPAVDISCHINTERHTCEEKEALLSVECKLLYEGDEPAQFTELIVTFADAKQREDCHITAFHYQEGMDQVLQPGTEAPIAEIRFQCGQLTWNGKLALQFGLYNGTWHFPIDEVTLQLRNWYFGECQEEGLIEGWDCEEHTGYPIWIFSPEARYQVLSSGLQEYRTGTIPSHGHTFDFHCSELPVSILIEGEEPLEAIAYGHDLPDFSAWLNYEGDLTLEPANQQTLNTGHLELNGASHKVLLRLPAFPEGI